MGVRLHDILDLSHGMPERAPVVLEVPTQYITAEPGALTADELARSEQSAVEDTSPSAAAQRRSVQRRPSLAARRRARRTRALLSALPPDPRAEAAARNAAPAPSTTDAAQTSKSRGSAALPAPALPEHLTREQVRNVMEALRPMLHACAAGAHGTALADITITGQGRVSYSLIDGDFAGTRAGSCMVRTLRGAEFPAFSGPSFKVRYPFAI